jgi:DNA-binding beta-propeller fold protein YncE
MIAAALITAALASSIGGCDEDGPTAPGTPVSWALLAPYTHIMDAPYSTLEFEYAIDSTYFYRIIYQPPRIRAGHIIIGSDGEGYIRRVTGVSVSGDRMILQTTRARLVDAVDHGETAVTIPIGFGSMAASDVFRTSTSIDSGRQHDPMLTGFVRCAEGVALSGGGISISDLTLFEQEISGYPASIRITEGYVEFNPTVRLGMMIWNGGIRRIDARLDGTFVSECDLSIDIPEPMAMAGELPLASAGRRIVHYMGRVPIVAVVELDFVLTYRFTGLYSGDCIAGFHGAAGLTLGSLYELGNWMDISSIESEAVGTPLSCGEFSNANMLISIEPRVRVILYGEPFAGMACGVHDSLAVSAGTPPVWEWSMSSTLEGTCGIDPDILAPRPEGYEIEPLVHTISLGSGPYSTDSYIFVLAWGSEGSGDYQFGYPRGIAADASGDIYVVDSWNDRIQKFAPDSTFIEKWGEEGSGDGQFLFPAAIAVDGTGNIYVTDSGNDRVQKFGPDAGFITAWGGSGSGPGEFQTPEGIAVDPSGNIYVADSGNNRVQKFTPDGLFITEWGGYGILPGELDGPIGVAADGAGNIYITECRNHRVQKFTSSGEPLALWGSYGTGEGEFDCPIAVAVDGDGFVYIADYGNDRIQKLTTTGVLVTLLGSNGTGEGEFDRPEGIVIDHAGFVFAVDSRNSRIQKFAPLQ